MLTTTITEAPYDTISPEEAKTHLRIYGGAFDVELRGTIAAAIDWCENATGRTLRTAVERLTVMAAWCELGRSLPWQPLLAVDSLKYYDEDNALQTVDPADYRVHLSAGAAAVIEFDSEFTLPTVAARSDAIQLTWTSGYASIDVVPPRAKQAIKTALKLFWGDLSASEVEVWERCTNRILGSIDWGSYR